MLLQTKSKQISTALISEVQIKADDKSDVNTHSEAYQNSSTATPIVVDSGATFGTTPFESDRIPGTVEKFKGSVRNLSDSSSIMAKGLKGER